MLSKDTVKGTKVVLFLIVLFGLILRLSFFSGVGPSDDLSYSMYAYNLKEIPKTEYFGLRLGIIYPTALSYRIFGVSDFSSVLFVLLISLSSIILVFYFGKLLFNEKTGLMAAFLMSIFPLEVVYSTKLLTDLPAAFFMSLGVYMFLYNEINNKPSWLAYLASGIAIGIGYLLRESVLLIALFFLIYMWHKKSLKKGYFFVAFGIIAVVIFESLVFLALTGDPLFRAHKADQYLANAFLVNKYFGRLEFPSGLFHYPWLFLTNKLLVFFYVFVFLAVFYSIVYKKKECYILLFWLIPLVLYLSFGSLSVSSYIPFRAIDRYLSIVTMPAILLMAFFLSEKKELIRKAIMPASLILLLLTSIGVLYLYEGRNQLKSLKAAYPFLESLDKNKSIYIDKRSLEALNYLSGYKNTMNLKPYPESLANIEDSYIAINTMMIKGLKDANKNRIFPSEIENAPKKWMLVSEIGSSDDEKIIVYYAS